jgi:hypothetical protein
VNRAVIGDNRQAAAGSEPVDHVETGLLNRAPGVAMSNPGAVTIPSGASSLPSRLPALRLAVAKSGPPLGKSRGHQGYDPSWKDFGVLPPALPLPHLRALLAIWPSDGLPSGRSEE